MNSGRFEDSKNWSQNFEEIPRTVEKIFRLFRVNFVQNLQKFRDDFRHKIFGLFGINFFFSLFVLNLFSNISKFWIDCGRKICRFASAPLLPFSAPRWLLKITKFYGGRPRKIPHLRDECCLRVI